MGTQLVTTWVTAFIVGIVLAFVNANIASRKAKSRALFGWITAIPLVGHFMFVFLVSLPDKDVVDKIDRILEKLEKKSGEIL